MKKMALTLAALSAAAVTMTAADAVIQFDPPEKTGGKTLQECLANRHTDRSFKTDAIPAKELGNILYAAVGVNRPDGRRTIPTALNLQDLTVYAALPQGLYRYDAAKHQLILVETKDVRALTSMRTEMAKAAPLALIYVSDQSKFKNPQDGILYAYAHAGSAYQNVYLYCASAGLGAVICGGVDRALLSKEMNLTKQQQVIVTQLVGYPK